MFIKTLMFFLLLSMMCSIAEPFCVESSLKKQFKESTIVFLGKATKVEPLEGRNGFELTTFEVLKAWKGIQSTSVQVVTYPVDSNGYPFKVGKSYLVFDAPSYAIGEGVDGYFTLQCTHTALADSQEAREAMRKLGKPRLTVIRGDKKD